MNPTTIHINRPRWDSVRRVRRHCPTCSARRTMVTAHQPWYGVTETCLGCGDRWTEGTLHPRPFQPGWRMQSIADARRLVRGAT